MPLDDVVTHLRTQSHVWLVTGAAGFIGSNLTEALLRHGQHVIGLDNFATGHQRNLDAIKAAVPPDAWTRFRFIHGDICSYETCLAACRGVDFVLHQAALGSIPRSLERPLQTNAANIDGFLNILEAARQTPVKRLIYAASSSTYGDNTQLPKVEDRIGAPLSPYALTKYVNELYAKVYARSYGFRSIGLRYFNVYGPRQDPKGAYAAVIPAWIASLIRGETVKIFGDGETSRDFTYIDNIVEINLLAAFADEGATDQVYNAAVGERTTLNELFRFIKDALAPTFPAVKSLEPEYRDFRSGDIRHSLADVSKAKRLLGYAGTHRLQAGIERTVAWHLANRPI